MTEQASRKMQATEEKKSALHTKIFEQYVQETLPPLLVQYCVLQSTVLSLSQTETNFVTTFGLMNKFLKVII